MNSDEVLELLQKSGAFRSGHFVGVSGLHMDSYINKNAMYAFTEDTSALCRAVAERFTDNNIEAVIGPAIGAAILSQWVAHHLNELTGKEVLSAWADKDEEGGFVIKRGYDDVIKGKRTLVVEDLTTTGGSIKKVVEAARTVGANVVAAVALVNRGNVTKEAVGNPPEFVSMADLELESWDAAECELCANGIPVNTDVGHGKEFMARKKS